MSPSQKASIVEGVGKDINIGPFDIRAENLLVKGTQDADTAIAYVSSLGRIQKLPFVYDRTEPVVHIKSGKISDTSKGLFQLNHNERAELVESISKDLSLNSGHLQMDSMNSVDAEVSG